MDPNVQESKLTAYALGELDPAEVPLIEAILARDEDARQWVEKVRKLAEPLGQSLQRQLDDPATPRLRDNQRRALHQRIAEKLGKADPQPVETPSRYSWLFPSLVSGALAACLALAAVGIYLQATRGKERPTLALSEQLQKDIGAPRITGHEKSTDSLAFRNDIPGADQSLSSSATTPAMEKRGDQATPPPPSASPNANNILSTADGMGVDEKANADRAALQERSQIIDDATDKSEGQPLGNVQHQDGQKQRQIGNNHPAEPAAGMTALVEETDPHSHDVVTAVAGATRAGAAPAPGAIAEARGPAPVENAFRPVAQQPLSSTFALTGGTDSYADVRGYLALGKLPPPEAVRVEQMLNYFTYDYSPPADGRALAVQAEVNQAPWAPVHRLVKIGISSRPAPDQDRPPANVVCFVDVAASKASPDKVPLLQQSLKTLGEKLHAQDRLAIVRYTGTTELVLESTLNAAGPGREKIRNAITGTESGTPGSGVGGIRQAYAIARDRFIENGINRVIFLTDGDVSGGLDRPADLARLARENRQAGLSLSVLSFGKAQVNHADLQRLADAGAGSCAYIDSLPETQRVLTQQLGATLVTAARNVKVQVEFNPLRVASYRLIGYENRAPGQADFNNASGTGGQIGAGQTITALYEVVTVAPVQANRQTAGQAEVLDQQKQLRYHNAASPTPAAQTTELLTVRVAYQVPEGDKPEQVETQVVDRGLTLERASSDFRFAAAVAQFAMILRHSPYVGDATLAATLQLATTGIGPDADGLRRQFNNLVQSAKALADTQAVKTQK